MERELNYQHLYEDLPCIAEMEIIYKGQDYLYLYDYNTVYIFIGDDIIYEDEHAKKISESEIDAHIRKVLDAKLFDGKTFEEAQKDIMIESLTYRKTGKYE